MLAEDAEAGAEDEKEVEELKKQGINPLPKPPPGVGLLPTPPRPSPGDSSTPMEFGMPGAPHGNIPPSGPPAPGPGAGPGPGPGVGPCPGPPPPCPDGGNFQGPLNPNGPPPPMGPPPTCGGNAGKKIPSLFEIVVKPTGQLAQKLGVRLAIFFFLSSHVGLLTSRIQNILTQMHSLQRTRSWQRCCRFCRTSGPSCRSPRCTSTSLSRCPTTRTHGSRRSS